MGGKRRKKRKCHLKATKLEHTQHKQRTLNNSHILNRGRRLHPIPSRLRTTLSTLVATHLVQAQVPHLRRLMTPLLHMPHQDSLPRLLPLLLDTSTEHRPLPTAINLPLKVLRLSLFMEGLTPMLALITSQ